MQKLITHHHNLDFRHALAHCLYALREDRLADKVVVKRDEELQSLRLIGVNRLPVVLATRAVFELTGEFTKVLLYLQD